MLPGRCQNIFLLLCSFLLFVPQETSGENGWGFLNPQSACKIECQNNGVCVYNYAEPDRHRCECMVGMYEGELCEFPVTFSTSTTEEPPMAAADEPIYEEEDQLNAGGSDVHYAEEAHDGDELHTLGGTSTTGEHPQQPADSLNAEDHGEEYAAFEPRRDEVYHQAVMNPDETTTAQVAMEAQTESRVYAESKSNYDQTENPPAYNQERAEELEDDSFYDNDGGWMMFKRGARYNAGRRCEFPLLLVGFFLLTWAFIQF